MRRPTVAVLLAVLLACGSPPAESPSEEAPGPADDAATHFAACPVPASEHSEQDERIHLVISHSTDDRAGAIREMAAKYGLSEDEVQDAFVRVLQAKAAAMDAAASRMSCLADQHGFTLLDASAAGDHMTAFVDAHELDPDTLDRFGAHLVELEMLSTVTLQLHVGGTPKLRRDYPLGAPPVR